MEPRGVRRSFAHRSLRHLACRAGLAAALAALVLASLYVNLLFTATLAPVPLEAGPGGGAGAGAAESLGAALILRAEGPVRIRSAGNKSSRVELVLSIDSDDLQDLIDDYRQGLSPSLPAYPTDSSFLLHNPTLCSAAVTPSAGGASGSAAGSAVGSAAGSAGGPGRTLDWIVYVHSGVFNTDRRQLLRDSWANLKLFKTFNFRVVFLVGRTGSDEDQAVLKEEFAQHGDIVQGNFQDDYKNLTLKAVMGLRWVSTYCPQARFAMKVDDDTFMNIFSMASLMRRHGNRSAVMICPLWGENSMQILRERKSCMKWCVRKRDLPGRTHFPQYCAGIGWAVSGSLITSMYNASHTTPFFWIDDVYVTGLLMKKVKETVEYVNVMDRFSLQEERALEQYENRSVPLTYDLVHTHNRHNFINLWNALLDRLDGEERALLNAEPSNFKLAQN